MSFSTPLTRPVWNPPRKEGYWRKFQCIDGCAGHIVPFDRLYEIHISEFPIDSKQWAIAKEQELLAYEVLVGKRVQKKMYPPKADHQKLIKIFGDWS
jgi:hypothetical protein